MASGNKKQGLWFADVKAAMLGQEDEFIRQFRNEHELSGKNQPCPGCGGDDRYRATKDGGFFCSNGGGYGDVFNHIQHTEGMSFAEVLRAAKVFLRLDNPSDADIKAAELRRARTLERKARLSRLNLDRCQVRGLLDHMFFVSNSKIEISTDEKAAAVTLIKSLKELYLDNNQIRGLK